jgi:predicted kinase
MLIVFGGLPGTGKTTLARALAGHLAATYLRIDTIEQAIRDAGSAVGPAGYLAAYALAGENLRLGRTVVADSANALTITRDAWRRVADGAGVEIVEVELICSDPVEHRRRIETRAGDIPGLAAVTWQQVVDRHYDAWDRPHLTLDTAGRTPAALFAALVSSMPPCAPAPANNPAPTSGTAGRRDDGPPGSR